MEALYDALLFHEDTPSEDIRVRLEENPDLERAWIHWRAVRSRLRRRLQEHLPERRLLVLYALEEAGHEAALTAEEREALTAARGDIEHALDLVPVLERVVERIQEERDAFETTWAEQTDGLSSADRSTSEESPSDSRVHEREQRAPRSPSRHAGRGLRRWMPRLALAVVLAGIAGLSVYFWPSAPSTTTVEVAAEETRVVDLGDGSRIRVVGAATLTHPTNMSRVEVRRVTLERGRAFFDVQRRTDGASFVVETPTARTSVLGTQFGVTTGADTTAVVLADGRVRVGTKAESSTESVVLEPGQRSRVVQGELPSTPTSIDVSRALEWTGLFVFRSTPRGTVAERFSLH